VGLAKGARLMSRTHKDNKDRGQGSKKLTKKAKRDLEKLLSPPEWDGKLDPRNGNKFISCYRKLKIEE
jgi:hypothetical protein